MFNLKYVAETQKYLEKIVPSEQALCRLLALQYISESSVACVHMPMCVRHAALLAGCWEAYSRYICISANVRKKITNAENALCSRLKIDRKCDVLIKRQVQPTQITMTNHIVLLSSDTLKKVKIM